MDFSFWSLTWGCGAEDEEGRLTRMRTRARGRRAMRRSRPIAVLFSWAAGTDGLKKLALDLYWSFHPPANGYYRRQYEPGIMYKGVLGGARFTFHCVSKLSILFKGVSINVIALNWMDYMSNLMSLTSSWPFRPLDLSAHRARAWSRAFDQNTHRSLQCV